MRQYDYQSEQRSGKKIHGDLGSLMTNVAQAFPFRHLKIYLGLSALTVHSPTHSRKLRYQNIEF
jgi:hypothetical protein